MNIVNTAILDPATGWFILAAFSALWVTLGWYFGRKTDELDDYVLAGRRVGLALGTATVMATWVTSNTTMAAPQLALQMGVWGVVGYSLGWLVSMGMAGGILIHALTGIPYLHGMTVILGICVGYTLLGGLRAVIGTDFIQAFLILVGIVIIAVLAIQSIGFDEIHSAVLRERPEL